MNGIDYTEPQVYLLQISGLGTSEFAARTAYDSFEQSENDAVKEINKSIENNSLCEIEKFNLNHIEHSDLLESLAWVHHHHSVIEHCNLTYLVKGTSRSVLQEHARHRIQSITVRSTRYTMNDLLYIFVAEKEHNLNNTYPSSWFFYKILELDMFVTIDQDYNKLQALDIFNKLTYQYNRLGRDEFLKLCLVKDSILAIGNKPSKDIILNIFHKGKKKRNAGDAFKHIVNDNWKVDMVVTFNLRSLKNYFTLRDSGAAYFQIQWLAKAMKEATPKKYLELIVKSN